jgi:hypothetical protein
MAQIALILVCAVAALVVGKAGGQWLFGAKKDLTKSRRAAQTLAIALREAGLRKIPVALEQYAVGDLPDLLEGIQDLATLVKSGSGPIMQELEKTFENALNVKLQSPEGRALIAAKLAEAVKIAAPIVIAAL